MKSRGSLFSIFIVILFLCIGGIFISNVYRYNNHWAYDAWGHIHYIETLAVFHRLPLHSENYLAWHEPLYYALNAFIFHPFINVGLTQGSSVVIKILQYESAFLGLLFVAGSTLLSWLITKNRGIVVVVALMTAFLPELSEASRFATNEILFQTMTIWFFVLFWYLRIHDYTQWTWKRWCVLGCLVTLLMYVKLTGLVVLLGLLTWLILFALKEKSSVPLRMATVLVATTFILVAPWFVYKATHIGSPFTINNYEKELRRERSHWMGDAFYTSWDNGIMTNPVWPAGTRSFWSMLYADMLGDYYNIFQHYENSETLRGEEVFTTANNRLMSMKYKHDLLFLYRVSMPLILLTTLGFIFFSFSEFMVFIRNTNGRNKKTNSAHLFLVVIAYGFLASLIYNTYSYPNVEQGTMKAIFILSFFPLYWIMSMMGLFHIWNKMPYSRQILVLFWAYLLFWVYASVKVIYLP